MKRVYFLRRADGIGPIKVGCSDGPDARRKQLQCDMRLNLVLLAQAPGSLDIEHEIHRRFTDHRVVPENLPERPWPIPGIKEWFAPVPALLELIHSVRETGTFPAWLIVNRDVIIFRRRERGETLRSIADDFGISHQRVCQIAAEMKRRTKPGRIAA